MNTLNSEESDNLFKFDKKVFYNETLKCISIEDALKLYEKYRRFNLPDIEFFMASFYLKLGEKEKNKEHLLNCSIYGFEFPNRFWNSLSIEVIGFAMGSLLTTHTLDLSDDVQYKLFKYSYLYLSRTIELVPDASNPFKSRGILTQFFLLSHFSHLVSDIFLIPIFINEILVMADFFNASVLLTKEKNFQASIIFFNKAKTIHDGLKDISVKGRDANSYTLQEISEIGKARNEILYKKLKESYENRELILDRLDLAKK